jgi:hypothetical protein
MVPAGNSLILKCPAIGNPPPYLVWMKDGKPFKRRKYAKPVFRAHSVRMHETTENDNGNYTCIAKNKHGSISWTYVVEVAGELLSYPAALISISY